jgi:hypothetical protein
MAEKHYLFLKENRVENFAVFAEQNDDLANLIASEQGHDSVIWFDEQPLPHKHALYNPETKTFEEPDLDYLYSIGVAPENQQMQDERNAKEQAELEAKAAATANTNTTK